ncbi:class I SAM-dependent methyltransferase [Pontibacter sp. G13]|uniref:class I SAM-dependent methyltransferase n=1 Tax=Pontibacter sp. G13 TaxID=3074898 RepID=UPI00288C1F04|nr:class I SAM-dependent methyltransferase [Pontibacter sp. G13]WNJ18866.1 class I SAM-dependent methyltransferase [Pontibacter sp. G13]
MQESLDLKFAANQEMWNQKTGVHLDSDFYELEAFKQGDTSLRSVELEEVGEVSGKSLLHLQCHFGMDSLSWVRQGAEVTAMDFSSEAIKEARNLSKELELPATFIESNLYDLPSNLQGEFDVVFTSYGVLGWLPDMDRWAEVAAQYVKPGGFLYLIEFHPVIWMHDEEVNHIEYDYFNTSVIEEITEGTYADREAALKHKSYSWNHSISEVVGALIRQGLQISQLNEFPFSTWDCFPNLKEIGHRKYVFKHLEGKIPYMYSLKAHKPA